MTGKTSKTVLKANEEKWGKANIEAGWTLIPNALLVHQATLGLKPMDINILLQISRFWWKADIHPFPSKQLLADSIGVNSRTVQGRISELVKTGFLTRVERRDDKGSKTNIYELTPLVEQLIPYSEDMVEEKKRRQAEDKARPKHRGKVRKSETKEATE